MDSGRGSLIPFNEPDDEKALQEQYPLHGGTFRVGETVELKGSKFRVKSIKPKELRLKLLPKKVANQSLERIA